MSIPAHRTARRAHTLRSDVTVSGHPSCPPPGPQRPRAGRSCWPPTDGHHPRRMMIDRGSFGSPPTSGTGRDGPEPSRDTGGHPRPARRLPDGSRARRRRRRPVLGRRGPSGRLGRHGVDASRVGAVRARRDVIRTAPRGQGKGAHRWVSERGGLSIDVVASESARAAGGGTAPGRGPAAPGAAR
jgi:hypothetical protein